ncbi:hypothetical protein [Ekhidna sp.]|uniref:hypothetical protein n=1 Tax=Ekhidna sp. TaxID=2608089 RepID=UPI003B50F47F
MSITKLTITGILAMLLFYSCKQSSNPEELIETEELTFEVNFNPIPPFDVPPNADSIDLIKFAWEEFIALNWKSSYSINGLRDNPDTSWNWGSSSDPFPDLAVWETYAHRTELRPYSNVMEPFNNPPHYSFGATLTPATFPDGSLASFTLFNNLDENNEIGSCNLYAHTNIYDQENMVLYQAKVNRDEYEYIYNNYNTKELLDTATSRTKTNIDKYNAYYEGATNSCDCPKEEGVLCLPCGDVETKTVGSIEIKTAWRLLVPEDTPSKYFTRNAIFYEKDNSGGITYSNKEFALIGMHIIHKTRNNEEFVFATWEHVDVTENNMGYVLLDNSGKETGPLYSNYSRYQEIPEIVKQSTQQVHSQISAMNSNSIWLNYQLVGVQGKPTNDSTSFSFFLANYVIESDTTLNDFHGSSIGTPHDLKTNTLSNGQRFSMGGCQGCHGVAQTTLGADFSFLMDNNGKPVNMPDLLDSIPPSEVAKLEKFIRATAKE